MSNEPRKPENGPDLERDLESVQAEWDRMERVEPPDLLDQAVVNAARRDLQAGRKKRPLRWLGGFATATVVVLALTVVLEQEPTVVIPTPGQSEGLQLQEAPAPAKSEASENLADEMSMPPAEPEPMRREARRRNDQLKSVAAPVAEPSESMADSPAKEEADLGTARKRDTELSAQVTELEEAVPEAVPEAMPEAPAAAPATAKSRQALMPPKTWIEYLLELKQAGRQIELESGIRAFRQAYPDHPLPAELADDVP